MTHACDVTSFDCKKQVLEINLITKGMYGLIYLYLSTNISTCEAGGVGLWK